MKSRDLHARTLIGEVQRCHQTDDGVVTIHSKEKSLDQAAEVINLALGVPDVRQIVYTMPSSVWKTAGGSPRRQSQS